MVATVLSLSPVHPGKALLYQAVIGLLMFGNLQTLKLVAE